MTVQELNTLLGNNIKYYRKKKGWTQTRLAQEIGLANNTLSGIERGVYLTGGKALVLISYVLGVKVWELFFDGEKK